jgi:7-carboxy-7-deazaguanine synthase
MTTLAIAETFVSIQGESTRAGRLCCFIRCAGCNLRCAYCDTLYAAEFNAGELIEIDKLVKFAADSGVALVEITGGEPLMQAGTTEFCAKIVAAGKTVLIETNGSLPIWHLPDGVIRIIDCKTPSSGESGRNLYQNYDYLTSNDEIKFVLADINDYSFAKTVIEQYQLFNKTDKILFSPVAGRLEPQTLAQWMRSDKSRAILQLQLHKIIWGAEQKGV